MTDASNPGLSASTSALAGGLIFLRLIGPIILGVAFFINLVQRGVILTPIGHDLHLASILLACCLTACLVASIISDPKFFQPRRLINVLGIAAGVLFLTPHFVESDIAQYQGFHNVALITETQRFNVVSTYVRKSRHFLKIEKPGTSFQTSIEAHRDLWATVRNGAWVSLPVQTGRGGVQRVMRPEYLDPADLHQD